MQLSDTLKPGMKGAFYGRYSTDKQEMTAQKHSVETLVKKYQCVITENYLDEAVSAVKKKMEKRPELQRLFEDAKVKKWEFVVVYKNDRLARDTYEHQQIRELMGELNIPIVISSTESLYNTGNLFYHISEDAFTMLEAANIRERTASTYKYKVDYGQWTGGKVPYGYRFIREGKKIIVFEEEAALVREIFGLYKKGNGFDSIAKRLPQELNNGKAWTKEKIKTIITNPFYAGFISMNRKKKSAGNSVNNRDTWSMSRCPDITPLIPLEDWEYCFKIFEQKRNGEVSPKFFKTSFLFNGLLICGHCSTSLNSKNQRTTSNSGKHYGESIYFCRACGVRVKAADLDQQVLYKLLNAVLNKSPFGAPPKLIHEDVIKHFHQQKEELEKHIFYLEDRFKELTIIKSRTTEELRAGLFDQSEENRRFLYVLQESALRYSDKLRKLEEEISKTRKRINHIQYVEADFKVLHNVYLDVIDGRRDLDNTATRRLILYLINKVVVNKDGNIQIEAKIDLNAQYNLDIEI